MRRSIAWKRAARMVTTPFLALEASRDGEDVLAEDRPALGMVEVRSHDRVAKAGLVLEREEEEALRGAGTLPHDHDAGAGDVAAVLYVREIGRARDAAGAQRLAQVRHRVRAGGEARGAEVGFGLLERRHLAQWRRGAVVRRRSGPPQPRCSACPSGPSLRPENERTALGERRDRPSAAPSDARDRPSTRTAGSPRCGARPPRAGP